MPELRWILLVLGALLIGGLWWWELRRSRQPAPPAIPAIDHESRGADRFEPRLDGAAPDSDDTQPLRAAEERSIPRGDPPVVTLPDLPEDADQIVLAREPVAPRRIDPQLSPARREPPLPRDSWPDEEVVPDLDDVSSSAAVGDAPGRPRGVVAPPGPSHSRTAAPATPAAPTRPPAPARADATRVEPRLGEAPAPESRSAAPRAPFGRREPSIETTADVPRAAPPPVLEAASIATGGSGIEPRRPAPRPSPPPRTAAPPEPPRQSAPPEPPSTLQRIVAIRLVAAGTERFDGAALRAALEAEGLRFGKYSIFHRQRADGRALYSIASLVEPGSFDLDRMHLLEFPGVSMFAVFPGPLDAPDVFDELLATARRLADRLDGALQDERGGPLSAQRALGLRDELVSFQNLVTRARSRPAG